MGDHLTTIDMGWKLGGMCPFWGGGWNSVPCNTMWPGPRPTSMPSFILIHSTVWPQYTNVTDRQDRQTDRQQTNSIGRTVLETDAQKPDYSEIVIKCIRWHCTDNDLFRHTVLKTKFKDFQEFLTLSIFKDFQDLENLERKNSRIFKDRQEPCYIVNKKHVIMPPPLHSRCGHYIFVLWFLLSFFLSSPNLSSRRVDVYHTSTHGVALVRI